VIVEFLGKERSAVLEEIDSGAIASVDRWKPLEWVKFAPAHTRWVRVRLISHRQSGDTNDGVYDGLSLKALRPAANTTAKNTSGGLADNSTQAEAGPGLPAQGPPQEQLKARGLIPSGSVYVLASEVEALNKFEQIGPIIKQMAQLSGRIEQIVQNETDLALAQENHNDFRLAFDEANAILGKIPNGPRAISDEKQAYEAQRLHCDGLKQERDNWWRAVESLRSQQAPAGLKEQLVRDFTAKQSEFRTSASALLPLLEKAREEHRKLEHDSVVMGALEAIRRSTKAAALSPARNLQNAIDTIKRAERAYALVTNAPKKKPKSKSAKAGK
jgi:hypothetical protein